MTEWQVFQIFVAIAAFVSVLLGIWGALMRPSKEAINMANQEAKIINKETQKAINDLSLQVATLNIHLTTLITSNTNNHSRLDKHKDMLYEHETKLSNQSQRISTLEKSTFKKEYTKEEGL